MTASAAVLGDLCTVVAGGTPARSRSEYFGGSIPWVKIGDMITSPVTATEETISSLGLANSAAKILPAGTVLLSIFATVGRTAILGTDAATNQAIAGITPADSEVLDPRYLRHYLDSAVVTLRRRARGVAQVNINLTILKALPIPLIPLTEQRRIADVLDKAYALRDLRCEAIQHWDSLAKAIFVGLFGDPVSNPCGWPQVSLGECALQVTDGEHQTPRREESGIKLLSARNVRDGALDFENVDFVAPAEYERIRKRCEPVRGDILISCSGSIGRVAPVETDEPFALVRSAALVRPDVRLVRSQFLHYMLRTPAVQSQMTRSANASSQANLFQRQIRQLSIFRPPLELQDSFTEKLAVVEQERTKQSKSLVYLQSLIGSLQNEIFRGAL